MYQHKKLNWNIKSVHAVITLALHKWTLSFVCLFFTTVAGRNVVIPSVVLVFNKVIDETWPCF